MNPARKDTNTYATKHKREREREREREMNVVSQHTCTRAAAVVPSPVRDTFAFSSSARAGSSRALSVNVNFNTRKAAVSRLSALSLRTGARSSRPSVSVAATGDDVTVSDTKQKFLEKFAFPLPALYSNVVNELIVVHHLIKYSPKHQYDKIYALGFVSIYDGIMDSYTGDKEIVFNSYMEALEEDPVAYRADAEKLTAWASTLSNVDDLTANEAGSEFQKEFSTYATGFEGRTRLYNKFFAIGMFRLLELASSTDPASLEKLAASLSVPLSKVTSDLATYKGMLSKMTAAKELMEEIIAEQRKKTAQREAERLQASASNGELPNGGGTPSAA